MADVAVANGVKLLVQIGDGASPEVFAHDCLINTDRGLAFSVDTNEIIVPDCDDPDLMAWKQVMKDGAMLTVTGAGVLHTTTAKSQWYDWLVSPSTKNVRVNLNVSNALGGGYWEGSFHLTAFEVTGTRNDKLLANVTLVSDGSLTWTAA